MLALAYCLATEGLVDRAFLSRYTVGYDEFERYLLGQSDGEPKTPDWAEWITGIAAVATRELARRMSSCRTFISSAWALQRQDHGEQPYWATIALASMLGQVGLPGGGFGFGYADESGMGIPRHRVRSPSLPVGSNPMQTSIPAARVSDLLLGPGESYDFNGERKTYPNVELVYWAGGNPFHHHQDIGRLVRAFRRPRSIIVHEIWWTATARHADIVLPVTTTLERNDIGASSRDRYLIAMQQAIAPIGRARSDHDILRDLADRFRVAPAFTEGRSEMDWLRSMYGVVRGEARAVDVELPEFETFWDAGFVALPSPAKPHTTLSAFREDPDHNPLATPSGRIEISSQRIGSFGYDDAPSHPTWLAPLEWLGAPLAGRYPLHLLSPQPATRLHGQMDAAGPSRELKLLGREPVYMNRADAAARGITDGDVVRVFNDRGAVLAGATLTDDLMARVVTLATGAWYDPLDPGSPTSLDKHGNPNVLTADRGTSRLGQGSTAHTTLVQIERWDGELSPITAHQSPAKGASSDRR